MFEMKNVFFSSESIEQSIRLLEWYTLARHVTPCPNCGVFMTSLYLCPTCGKRYELIELKPGVVTIVNGGEKVISNMTLNEMTDEAGADMWECVTLPDKFVKSDEATEQRMQPTGGWVCENGHLNPPVDDLPFCLTCKAPRG